MRFVFMVLECMAGLQNGGQGSMLPMEKIFLFQKREREGVVLESDGRADGTIGRSGMGDGMMD